MPKKFIMVFFGSILALQPMPAFSRDNQIHQYKKMPFIGGGYSEKVYTRNNWKTRGFTWYGAVRPHQADADNAPNKAFYRMALLARAGNFRFFQVYKAWFEIKTDGYNYINANSELWGIAVDNLNAPVNCKTNSRAAEMCGNYDVDKVISEIGPQLGQDSQMSEEEVSLLRSKI